MNAATAPDSLDFTTARRRVRTYAGRALFRMRFQEFLRALNVVMQVSAWLLVLLLLADKLFSLNLLGVPIWTVWGGLSAMLLPYVLWRVFSPQLSVRNAAVLADDRLGLHARMSTALALDPATLKSRPGSADAEFGAAFYDECLGRLKGMRVQQAFPVRVPHAFGWLAIPAALTAGIFYLVPDQDVLGVRASLIAKRRADERQKQAAKILEGKLEDLKKAAEKTSDQPGDQKLKQILQKTADALKEMKEGKRDPDEALLALGALKHEVAEQKQKLEDGKSFVDRLEKLSAKDLNLEDGALSKAVSEALKMGDPGLAAREMRKLAQKMKDDILDNPNKSDAKKQEELEQLKGELEKLSGALADDKELSKDLYQLAKSSMSAAEFQKLEAEMKKQLEKQNKGNGKLGDDLLEQAEQAASELERLEEDNDTNMDEKDEAEMEKLEGLETAMDEAIENLTGEGEQKNGQGKPGGDKPGKGSKSGAKGKSGGKSARGKVSKLGGSGKSKGSDKEGQGKSSAQQGGEQNGGQQNGQPNNGLGGGPGQGKRPYRDGDAEFESQKAKGEMRAGAITGLSHFRGQGSKGEAPTEFIKALEAAEKESSSSLELERIPADAREAVKDYFSKVREATQAPAPPPAPPEKK